MINEVNNHKICTIAIDRQHSIKDSWDLWFEVKKQKIALTTECFFENFEISSKFPDVIIALVKVATVDVLLWHDCMTGW